MEWTQFTIFFIGVFGLWFWNRSEGRADARHFDQETKQLRRDLIDAIQGLQTSMDTMKQGFQSSIDSIKEEIKDFHGRLCILEERRNEQEKQTAKLILEELRKGK